MPRRRSEGFFLRMSSPSMLIVPEVGSIIRLIIRSEVVLPQPDGPTKTVICPDGISRVRSSTATVPSGYRLVTPSNLIKSDSLPRGGPIVRDDRDSFPSLEVMIV